MGSARVIFRFATAFKFAGKVECSGHEQTNNQSYQRKEAIMKLQTRVATVLAIAALLGAGRTFAQNTTQSPVKCNPPASVIAKAKSPAPPADAKKATSVGKGNVKVNTANTAEDTDSFWVEALDIDGDGNVEKADVLWDDEDKVLYLHAAGTFTCANGGTGEGSLLIAIFAEGNPYKKPAGSGWYVVELDKSECAAQSAGLFGCKFDAKGNATACGAVKIDEKNDDIIIAAVSK